MPDTTALDEYRRRHDQPCENFELDQGLPQNDRDRFMAHLESYRSGSDYDDHLNDFFHRSSNKKLGPPVTLTPHEILGACRRLSVFASRFTKTNGFDQDPHDAEDLVREYAELNAHELIDTFHMLFQPDSTVCASLMWSYRNPPHYSDPFRDVDLFDLPCRLALPSYGVAREHIAFGHQSPPATFTATSFDAELEDRWRSGGMTRPLPDCERKYPVGLPEIVHDPNTFHNVATRLYLIS